MGNAHVTSVREKGKVANEEQDGWGTGRTGGRRGTRRLTVLIEPVFSMAHPISC